MATFGRRPKICSACAEKGKAGPWCLADRPCVIPSTPSRSHSAASTPEVRAQRLISAPAGGVSSAMSRNTYSPERFGNNPPPYRQVASPERLGRTVDARERTGSRTSVSGSDAKRETSRNARTGVPMNGMRFGFGPDARRPSGSSANDYHLRRKSSPSPVKSKVEEISLDDGVELVTLLDNHQKIIYQIELQVEKLRRSPDDQSRGEIEKVLMQLVRQAEKQGGDIRSKLGAMNERNCIRREKQKETKETKAGGGEFISGSAAEEIARLQQQLENERADLEKQRIAMGDALQFVRTECEKKISDNEGKCRSELAAKEAECTRRCAEMQANVQQELAMGQLEQNQKTSKFYNECKQQSEADKADLLAAMEIQRKEKDRMRAEKAELDKQLREQRAEHQKKLADEEAENARTIRKMRDEHKELRVECERKILEEKAAADKQLIDGRNQVHEQLRTEREVTDRIMCVLRELPPLQAAMELGDLALLEEELKKWRFQGQIPERFGECRSVVEAVVKLAEERLLVWRGVDRTWKDILKETAILPTTVAALRQQSQRVFRVLKESQLTKMDLRRSDVRAMERVLQLLLAWQDRAMSHSNVVQRLIVHKAATWPNLGPFDFADLDICLRLVDRKEQGSEAFLSRAKALVEDDKLAPHELRPLLTSLEAMLFYLKYINSEDLHLTHSEFRKQARELEPEVLGYIDYAAQQYPPGGELVKLTSGMDLFDSRNVSSVMNNLRKSPSYFKRDSLADFREIFYQWALAMYNMFNLLVLPHHTQVVTLLTFQKFLESAGGPHTLVAQVGTGEGKSMIIATLAIYIAVTLRRKVHVIIDDETLLERDFGAFKKVFDVFQVQDPGRTRQLTAELCVSEERLASRSSEPYLAARVNPNADIVYCEAKHVQSFYASIARSERPDFDTYKNRVLILDEVDALVVDEEPNDVFVYPNDDLSQLATSIAESLSSGSLPEDIRSKYTSRSDHPAAPRMIAELLKAWEEGKKLQSGKDYVYVKESNRYAQLHAGRANIKAWSLALECRNFQDNLTKEILFQERLFVTSRPRVFKKYSRVLGLSGSIGNRPEQAFLKETYRASFFKVPPFLKTCKGSPFHEAVPVGLGESRKAVYVEATAAAQLVRLSEVALDARERVPVLVIAKDRQVADTLVEKLRAAARSRGLGALAEDVVRSLSRNLYESNPEQWKENLNRSTLPLGDGSEKCWRVTVTDTRGGRGVDYRVDDTGVDAQGGLLLIPTIIPTARRDWTQFLGRTARQDCRGQYCSILCSSDYEDLSKKYKEVLDDMSGTRVVDTILEWGDKEANTRIRESAALYNTGLRFNELCEEVFSSRFDLLKDRGCRETLVEACQRVRWMSVQEVDNAFARFPSFNPAGVPTEAVDLGRPCEPPVSQVVRVERNRTSSSDGLGLGGGSGKPISVLFCLDWSASMMSKDTGTRPLRSRFEICVDCITKIIMDRIRDVDSIGIVGFGPNVQVVAPPTRKAEGGAETMAKLQALRPQMAGGTKFYDAVEHCVNLFNQPDAGGDSKWLVCLTDGDDAGSSLQNRQGEVVSKLLATKMPRDFNLLVITVGEMKAANIQIITSWTQRVASSGGLGRLLAEKDAGTIGRAFDEVAEFLTAEVGGAIEC